MAVFYSEFVHQFLKPFVRLLQSCFEHFKASHVHGWLTSVAHVLRCSQFQDRRFNLHQLNALRVRLEISRVPKRSHRGG